MESFALSFASMLLALVIVLGLAYVVLRILRSRMQPRGPKGTAGDDALRFVRALPVGAKERVVIVEHPYRPNYRIVSKTEPKERSRSVYRFEVKIPAGKTAKLEVAEEQDLATPVPLARIDGSSLRFFLECELTNAKAKTALEKVVTIQDKVAATQKETAQSQQQLAEIARDQERLRANIKEMPQTAAAYKRYLEKFDSQ